LHSTPRTPARYGQTGQVGSLKRGFRAVVYAGSKDPIAGRKTYLKETHPIREAAEAAKIRMIGPLEAERIPDQAAAVEYLLDRWIEVADQCDTASPVMRAVRSWASGAWSFRGQATPKPLSSCASTAPPCMALTGRAPDRRRVRLFVRHGGEVPTHGVKD
jgi:hypothetical protein